eukprot:CAMPEP_0172315686 /NCGR_PEP_ID=MMETSP1058-20130122/25981_1 /TAXON_ID=83371 /ORGANISM="Detonula confervacea, Strain CCMP 353" /LENGTH=1247 /DNA_ID=CAMNT_0013029825 /DNA_START=112 /DNA_END=3855 /DNA_ORIENTATION=+
MTSSNSVGVSTYTIKGHFNPNEIEETSNPYPRPLFLVPLPPLASQHASPTNDKVDMLAYGGDDGWVHLLNSDNGESRVIRNFANDGEVRALAVSPDGLRIAVGFEDGCTKIFSYDDHTSNDDEDEAHHPFTTHKVGSEENDNGFSQASSAASIEDHPEDLTNKKGVFDGPRMDACIRQLAFDPRSRAGEYHLAVASESGNKPVVVADVTDGSTCQKLYLEKSKDEFDGSGVRSVAYSVLPSTAGGEGNVLLASLGMNPGKLVTWDVTSTSDPSLLWDVCCNDYNSYAANDAGEMGGDSGDKGCRVVWDRMKDAKSGEENMAALFLPGKNHIQYRMCPLSKSKDGRREVLDTSEYEEYFTGPPKFIEEVDGNGHKDTIVAVAVSPNGDSSSNKRMVTGGRDGKLLLWEVLLDEKTGVATEIALERRANTIGIPPITSIEWYKEEDVHVAFADGTVVTVPVDAAGKSKVGKNAKALEASQELDELSEDEMSELATQPVDKDDDAEEAPRNKKVAFNEDSDDDDFLKEDVQPTSSSKASKEKAAEEKNVSNKKDASKFIDDEADDGDDDNEIEYDDFVETPSKANANDNHEQTAAGDNIDDNPEDDADDMFDSHNDPIDTDYPTSNNDPDDTDNYAPSIPLQPAFAPSSTPLTEPRRILCWNHVGVVTLREDTASAGNHLVDIAFHETAGLVGGRRPVTFTDNTGFIVGTLGEEGGMFASDLMEEDEDELEDEDEFEGLGVMSEAARKAVRRSKKRKSSGGAKGSSIYFHRFETFGRNTDKDWVVGLPDGERALGCATGTGWGAVITGRRFLRLFTISGIQGPVLWIPGTPVTVVGRDRFCAVFYHTSPSAMSDRTQLLGYTIFDGLTGATVASGQVSALSAGSSLNWAGFSDKCALSIMDSDGMLSMLARYPGTNSSSNNGNWMPMLDTVGLKKTMNDNYWPVEVHGGKLICVLLRGGREYPDAGRRPVTTTLNLRIPLATGLTVKSGPLEEGSVRAIFALNQEKVLDDYLVSTGDANEDEIEEEYNQKCNAVDKCTLKLFSSIVQAGKVERGYDLVQRLHSEKAMDLAIQMAERVGHRKLCDRIEDLKQTRYPPMEEEEEVFDDAASFDSGMRSVRSERSNGSFYEEEKPVIATRQQRLEMSQRISPEVSGALHTPRQQTRRSRDNEELEGEYSTDEESPPRESLKRKFENDVPASKRRINPFAKKMMESPAKGIMKVASSPTKLSLSRASTFSAKSRQKQRSGKQIV